MRLISALVVGSTIAAYGTGCGSTGNREVQTTNPFAGLHPVERVSKRCAGGGILGTQESLGGVPIPESPEVFHVTNIWHRSFEHLDIDVHAGAPVQHPAHGTLIVTWTNPDVGQPMRKSGDYSPDVRTGPLVLTCVRNSVVFFRFKGGTGEFNLKTRRFRLRRNAS